MSDADERWPLSSISGKKEGRIDTGFPLLDATLKGLWPGQLILVGARPGCGKSAMCMEMTEVAAMKGKTVLHITAEMLAGEAGRELLAEAADGVNNLTSLLNGMPEDEGRWAQRGGGGKLGEPIAGVLLRRTGRDGEPHTGTGAGHRRPENDRGGLSGTDDRRKGQEGREPQPGAGRHKPGAEAAGIGTGDTHCGGGAAEPHGERNGQAETEFPARQRRAGTERGKGHIPVENDPGDETQVGCTVAKNRRAAPGT